MEMNTLKDLYVHELQDLYSAESQILEALPKMEKESKHESLKNAFREHIEVTRQQKARLESIFNELGEKPTKVSCEGIEGIIKEGESLIKADKSWFRSGKIDENVMDAAMISNAQRVEHYEMAGYGSVVNYANRLGYTDHATLLRQTLEEERETDRKLTELAESSINIEAQRPGV